MTAVAERVIDQSIMTPLQAGAPDMLPQTMPDSRDTTPVLDGLITETVTSPADTSAGSEITEDLIFRAVTAQDDPVATLDYLDLLIGNDPSRVLSKPQPEYAGRHAKKQDDQDVVTVDELYRSLEQDPGHMKMWGLYYPENNSGDVNMHNELSEVKEQLFDGSYSLIERFNPADGSAPYFLAVTREGNDVEISQAVVAKLLDLDPNDAEASDQLLYGTYISVDRDKEGNPEITEFEYANDEQELPMTMLDTAELPNLQPVEQPGRIRAFASRIMKKLFGEKESSRRQKTAIAAKVAGTLAVATVVTAVTVPFAVSALHADNGSAQAIAQYNAVHTPDQVDNGYGIPESTINPANRVNTRHMAMISHLTTTDRTQSKGKIDSPTTIRLASGSNPWQVSRAIERAAQPGATHARLETLTADYDRQLLELNDITDPTHVPAGQMLDLPKQI